MNGTISNNSDERGLLPYPVILAATKGDPDAMKLVLQHYQSYIAHLSMQKIRDESGNTYWGIDEDLRERLQAKLMRLSLTSRQINAKCKASPFPLCAFNLTLTLLLDKESPANPGAA